MDMLGMRCIRIAFITVPVVGTVAFEVDPMRLGLIPAEHVHTVWVTIILFGTLDAAIAKFALSGNATREVTIFPCVWIEYSICAILTLAIIPTFHPITDLVVRF